MFVLGVSATTVYRRSRTTKLVRQQSQHAFQVHILKHQLPTAFTISSEPPVFRETKIMKMYIDEVHETKMKIKFLQRR